MDSRLRGNDGEGSGNDVCGVPGRPCPMDSRLRGNDGEGSGNDGSGCAGFSWLGCLLCWGWSFGIWGLLRRLLAGRVRML